MTGLDSRDAIWVTSWASYNDGTMHGGWIILEEVVGLPPRELEDVYEKLGLDPSGYDEELVIHDYDDYSGIGLYEMFGETHPEEVINFYALLMDLDSSEITIVKAIREAIGPEEAREAVENGALGDYILLSEEDIRDDFYTRVEELDIPQDLKDAMDADKYIRDYSINYFKVTIDNTDYYLANY